MYFAQCVDCCRLLLIQAENVRLVNRLSPRRSCVGTLYLTATHTIYVENETQARSETWVGTHTHSLHVTAPHQVSLYAVIHVKSQHTLD